MEANSFDSSICFWVSNVLSHGRCRTALLHEDGPQSDLHCYDLKYGCTHRIMGLVDLPAFTIDFNQHVGIYASPMDPMDAW